MFCLFYFTTNKKLIADWIEDLTILINGTLLNLQSSKETYSLHSSNWSAINLLPKLTILAFQYLKL
jgi:hypothetical protein